MYAFSLMNSADIQRNQALRHVHICDRFATDVAFVRESTLFPPTNLRGKPMRPALR